MAELFLQRDDETGACTVYAEMAEGAFLVSGPYPTQDGAQAQAERLVRFVHEALGELAGPRTPVPRVSR